MKKNRKLVMMFLAVVLAFSLTACGSDMSYGSVTESMNGEYASDDLYYEEDFIDGGATIGSKENVSSNRKLIKTVDLSAETYEFDALVSKIEAKVNSLGGYMENASIHTRYDDLQYGDFVIRIPVKHLDAFVTEVCEISNITDRDITQEDVTLSYVDLESHKAALEAEEKSLLNLLENAASVEDIIVLQQRLTDVRYQVESMESQLRTMDNLIDYATINLNISEVETYTPLEEPSMGERISTGFKESLETIGYGVKNCIILVAVNSPYLAIAAVIVLVIVITIRIIIKVACKKIDEQNKSQNGQKDGK